MIDHEDEHRVSSIDNETKRKKKMSLLRVAAKAESRLIVHVILIMVVLLFCWPMSSRYVADESHLKLQLASGCSRPARSRQPFERHSQPSSAATKVAMGRGIMMAFARAADQLEDEDDETNSGDSNYWEIELTGDEFYVYEPRYDELFHHPQQQQQQRQLVEMPISNEASVAVVTPTNSTSTANSSSILKQPQPPLMSFMVNTSSQSSAGSDVHLAANNSVLAKSPLGSGPIAQSNNSSAGSAQIAQLDEQKKFETRDQKQVISQQELQQQPNKLKLSQRLYCIGQKDPESTFNWMCQGLRLIKVPADLSPKPMSLRLSSTGIENLTNGSLMSYRDTLRDFYIFQAPKLISFDCKCSLYSLAWLHVRSGEHRPVQLLHELHSRVWTKSKAVLLTHHSVAVSGLHPDLTIVRIQQTGLRRWPDFSQFKQQRILSSVDLDNNKITTLGSKPINMRTELLNLEFNHIGSVEEFTFNGSEIGILSLNGNRQLTHIHPNAFANLKNLVKLDLSSTSLQQLPTAGLHQLRKLIIKDTYALKRIPSIYVFPMLEDAQLTYAYHCCGFRYPQRHDPSAYEEHLKLQEEINRVCSGQREHHHHQQQQQQQQSKQQPIGATTQSNSDFEGFFDDEQKLASSSSLSLINSAGGVAIAIETSNSTESSSTQRPEILARTITTSSPISLVGHQQQVTLSILTSDKSPTPLDLVVNQTLSQTGSGNGGVGTDMSKLWLMRDIECGEVAAMNTLRNISCTPEPDAFNPCEDIMGYSVLRVAVWFVVGASVFGNLSVIIVLAGIFRRLSVPKFLQLNLAIGDLFMGVYLALLALADLTTVGTYFNYAIDWQHGFGCKVAGAASLFASQLSIFTLSVITFERYYTITYSIDLNMRLQLGWAARIMFIGWLYAFASAMLPIFADINSYSKTSICLPLRTAHLLDRVFIFVLLTIDFSAFVIIFACYLKMYLLIIRQKTQATAKERTVAMRMALLVSTDFACWAPIIFFGTTALFGWPLISVTNSKILIVFFYPLNSMANPFLYVISTRQYRRDLNYLTVRWNVWRKNLFRRNQDSCYYSNNHNPYAVAGNQYEMNAGNALNVHLGAVAAVTGVANHLRYNHMDMRDAHEDGKGKAAGPTNQGINMHEQRVISTKFHQGRSYVIRHQILTDKQSGARGALQGGSRFDGSRQSSARRTTNHQAKLYHHLNSNGNTNDGPENEPDWSDASKLTLRAATGEQQVGCVGQEMATIEAEDRFVADNMNNDSARKKTSRKHKCRICNSGSLASCCTRCYCCKSTQMLGPCSGTMTTIISGSPTSQQQQQQSNGNQCVSDRSKPSIKPADLSLDLRNFTLKNGPIRWQPALSQLEIAAQEGEHSTDRQCSCLADGKDENCPMPDSSVTVLGNISSAYTEATSSFSNFSSNSQFEVPAITIRCLSKEEDEEQEGQDRALDICHRQNKHRPHRHHRRCNHHDRKANHNPDQDDNQDHDHRHHHREYRRHRSHQENARDEISNTDTTNSTNPSSVSYSLEPPDRSICRHSDRDRNQSINHDQCKRHRRHRHHHRCRHHQSRCSCRDEPTSRCSSEHQSPAVMKLDSPGQDSIPQLLEAVNGNLTTASVDGMPRDSFALSNVSEVRKTFSAVNSKLAIPLGSILKTTVLMNDDGALAANTKKKKEQLTMINFIRGGSLRSQRVEKKKVSIVSPHHSG